MYRTYLDYNIISHTNLYYYSSMAWIAVAIVIVFDLFLKYK